MIQERLSPRLRKMLRHDVPYKTYDSDRDQWITKTQESYKPGTKWAAFGLSVLTLVGLVHDSGADVLGDKRTMKPTPVLHQEAVDKYSDSISEADPATKFSMQFTSVAEVVLHQEFDDGQGILRSLVWAERKVTIDADCLDGTAYDINGGTFSHSVGGFRFTSRAEASIPTAAAVAHVSSDRPDVLTVRSGNPQGDMLTFTGTQEGILVPADSATQDVLDTHGCVPFDQAVSDKVHHA